MHAREWSLLLLVACAAPSAPEELAQARQPMADTAKEDVFAQAPYRVEGLDTVIPVDVVIADARRAGLLIKTFYLNSVTVSVQRSGAWTPLFRRDFGGIDLAASGATNALWLLHVTKGIGAGLIDGKPITARNLGITTAGQTVDLQVVVNASGGKGSDDKKIHLRTRVAEAPSPHRAPRFADWYAGDLHVHTMYTNNWAEFGLPHRALLHAATATGLDWLATTDHSNDLDPTCDGRVGVFGDNVSTLVSEWTFCENDQAMPCTYRNHLGVANGFLMAEDDARDAEAWGAGFGSKVRLHTAEEVTANSAAGKTVHALAFRTGYVEAKGSGATVQGVAIDCDPITVTLQGLLGQVAPDGFVYAAHPTQPLKPGINGGAWAEADFQSALASAKFAGFQIWNTHITRSVLRPPVADPDSSSGLDPFANGGQIGNPCDPSGAECHPYYLHAQAIPLWDTWLSRRCATKQPGPFAAAGSDTHGDFNFTTTSDEGLTVDIVDDNALGRVRTVARAPGGAMSAVLDAIQAGRTVLTDGPMIAFGVDKTGDGTLAQADDVQIGARITVPERGRLVLRLEWETTAEYGDLGELRLVRGDKVTSERPLTYQAFTDPEKLGDCATQPRTGGSCQLEVSKSASFGLPAKGEAAYFRVEAETKDGQFLALTNPIWVETGECTDPKTCGAAPGAEGCGCGAAGAPMAGALLALLALGRRRTIAR